MPSPRAPICALSSRCPPKHTRTTTPRPDHPNTGKKSAPRWQQPIFQTASPYHKKGIEACCQTQANFRDIKRENQRDYIPLNAHCAILFLLNSRVSQTGWVAGLASIFCRARASSSRARAPSERRCSRLVRSEGSPQRPRRPHSTAPAHGRPAHATRPSRASRCDVLRKRPSDPPSASPSRRLFAPVRATRRVDRSRITQLESA